MFIKTDGGKSTDKRRNHNNDCTVRSMSIAFQKDYEYVFDLCESKGKKKGKGMTKNQWLKVMEILAKETGKKIEKLVFHAVAGEERMKTPRFVTEYPQGTFILRQAHHIATVVDGNLYDSWDSSQRCIYLAFKIS